MNWSKFWWRPDQKTELTNVIGTFITVNPDDFLWIFNLEICVVRLTGISFDFRKLSSVFRAKHQAAYAIYTTLLGSIYYLDLWEVFDWQWLQACVNLAFCLHHRGCNSVRQQHLERSKIVTINSTCLVSEVNNLGGHVLHHFLQIVHRWP